MPGSMQPGRLAENIRSAGSNSSKDGAGDSWNFSNSFSKDTATVDVWTSSYGGHHLHHSPSHTTAATLKSISRGSYLPTQTTTTSTFEIVDQVLNVVESASHVTTALKEKEQQQQILSKISLHESQIEQDDLPPSLMASVTSFSSADCCGSSPVSVTGASSGSNCCIQGNIDLSSVETQPEDSNVIIPSLRKIAKKRRKEKARDGTDRSSFHHTKSDKEYLRKAQEALKQERGEQSDDSRGAPVPLAKEVAERLLSAPPSVFARRGPGRSSLHNPTRNNETTAPESEKRSTPLRTTSGLSRCQSAGDLKLKSSSPCNKPPSSQSDDDSNPYGYEDPDAVASGSPLRRMGPARRRGSVTKFSLSAIADAKAVTERIMMLQGLKLKPESPGCNAERRSATPTGRRPHPRRNIGMFTNVNLQHESRSRDPLPAMEAQIRQSSIPLVDRDTPSRSDESLKYGYEDVSSGGNPVTSPSGSYSNSYGQEYPWAGSNGTTGPSTGDLYGYGDPDACTNKTESNPYGYEDPDMQPQPPRRRHPRPTRRGSVTKFSVESANVVAAAVSESVHKPTASTAHETSSVSADLSMRDTVDQEAEEDLVGDLKPSYSGGLDSFLSRHSPYLVSSQYYQGGVSRTSSSHSDAGDSGDGLSRGMLSSRQGISPRRTGSYRRSRRFSAENLRSDSFRSGISCEDDADSLAPDMESLCSIHDRAEDNDFPPMPPLQPAKSPLTPRHAPNRSRSGSSLRGGLLAGPTHSSGSLSSDGFHLQPKRTPSGRTGLMVTVPAETGVAILPHFGGPSVANAATSSSEYLMPAPVKRNPSNSSSVSSVKRTPSNSSGSVPCSIHATLPSTDVAADGRMGRRASLAN